MYETTIEQSRVWDIIERVQGDSLLFEQFQTILRSTDAGVDIMTIRIKSHIDACLSEEVNIFFHNSLLREDYIFIPDIACVYAALGNLVKGTSGSDKIFTISAKSEESSYEQLDRYLSLSSHYPGEKFEFNNQLMCSEVYLFMAAKGLFLNQIPAIPLNNIKNINFD